MVKQLEPKKTEKAVFYCITPNFPKYNELLEITHELISGQETNSIARIAYIPSTKEIRIYMKGD